jgi:hypothetical protein
MHDDDEAVDGGDNYDTIRILKWQLNSIFSKALTQQPIGQLERSARIHKIYQ